MPINPLLPRTGPLPPGSPGGPQTPMQVPQMPGGQPPNPFFGQTGLTAADFQWPSQPSSQSPPTSLGPPQTPMRMTPIGGQSLPSWAGEVGDILNQRPSQPSQPSSQSPPTSLGPPQGGIDYGQSLENIMEQYKQWQTPPTPTLQGLRQQAPTPRVPSPPTSRFDQTNTPMRDY
jgi:hypothetical protein